MNLYLQPDWHRVLGQCVEVRRHGQVVRTGTVENVMPDDSMLWISAAGTFTRKLLEKAEGYEVYAPLPAASTTNHGLMQPAFADNKTYDGPLPASVIQDS